MKRIRSIVHHMSLSLVAIAVALIARNIESTAQNHLVPGGSQGPLADSCGVSADTAPAPGQAGRNLPVFPPGQFPIKLPQISLLGAHNDLPNPYQTGAHWGQLPEGRKWGS